MNRVFLVHTVHFCPREPSNVHYADVERRLTRRQSLKVLVTLRVPGKNLGTTEESLDVTERGLLLETELELEVGWPVELELILPELVTGEPPTEWHCRGVIAHVTMRDGPNRRRVGIGFDCVSVRNMHVA
jgi:hypothetical protein